MHSEKKNKRLPQPRVSEQTECLDHNKGIAMSEVAKRTHSYFCLFSRAKSDKTTISIKMYLKRPVGKYVALPFFFKDESKMPNLT